ncbi:MAG: hypothetical protein ACXV0U_03710 [Kineosporiaceae bacterium]
MGIESLVWLTDVAGLDRDQAAQLLRETAHACWRAVRGPDGDGAVS